MLELILGKSRAETMNAVFSRLRQAVRAQQGNQILVVPEQFSYDAERQLCRTCGDCASRYAEVLSFTRLSERVCAIYGGVSREALDDGGRFTALALALEQVLPQLKVYAAVRAKPEFLVRLTVQLQEFKNYGVDAQALQAASCLFSGAFAQKLQELSLILESYDAVCAAGKADPSSKLERLSAQLWETEFAADKTFYFDGFTDFTGLQLAVLKTLFRLERPVVLTLVCDELAGGQAVYNAARQTATMLLRLASSLGQQTRVTTLPGGTFLQQHLFSQTPASSPEQDFVVLGQAAVPEEECCMAAAQIRRLLQQGYRCRQIAVACTDRGAYVPYLRPILTRYGIPAYYSGKKELLQEPVLRAVLSALRSVIYGFQREDLFSFLHSPLSPISQEACDQLEHYAFTWNLQERGWKKPLTHAPGGFGAASEEAVAQQLAQLNAWRNAAMTPLFSLQERLQRAKNTQQQVLALFHFLEAVQVRQRLETLAAQTENLQRAQELSQVYEVLLDAMEQMALVLGQTVHTPEEFLALLRQLLTQYSLGSIPAQLDSVRVGDLPSLRHSSYRAVLVLGAADGMLPQFAADGGILTDQERILLQKRTNLHLAPDKTGRMDRELATVYDVLSAAQQVLYLSYSGETPSYLVRRLEKLYPAARRVQPSDLPCNLQEAGAQVAAQKESLRAQQLLRLGGAQVAQLAQKMEDQRTYQPGALSRQAVQQLYGAVIPLSASRIDLFSSCRFAYYLQYGLFLQPWKTASVDAPLFGSFVHAVLECTLRRAKEENTLEAPVLREIAEEEMQHYLQTQIGEEAMQEARFRYLLERNLEEVRQIVASVGEELRASQFRPAAFELDFRPGGSLPPVEIRGKSGTGRVTGFVDRVDVLHRQEADYIRVVDYKTGQKAFSYGDIAHGMGLQMLLYLFTLQRSGEALWGRPVRPAGVLYIPARMPVLSSPVRPSPEEAEAMRQKAQQRSGLLLRDASILEAMEAPQEGKPLRYLPCKLDKAGNYQGDLASTEQFAQLGTYIFHTIEQITDAIAEGQVHPNPYFQGSERSVCQYCPFSSVCHLDSCNPEIRHFASQKAEEFWKRLEGDGNG